MSRPRGALLGLGLAWLLVGAPATGRADVVELTTGQRIQGTVKEATPAGVVIVVGGREMRIRQERIRSISFEAVRRAPAPAPSPVTVPVAARPPAAPPPPPLPAGVATAVTALGRLQAVTTRPVAPGDYAALVEEVRREVERSLGDAPADHADTRRAIGTAIRYHAFAALAGTVYDAKGDLASVGRDPLIAECRQLAELVAGEAARLGLNPIDPVVVGLIAASEGPPALRACASEKITEAETRAREGR